MRLHQRIVELLMDALGSVGFLCHAASAPQRCHWRDAWVMPDHMQGGLRDCTLWKVEPERGGPMISQR